MIIATCPLCKFEFEVRSVHTKITGELQCERGYDQIKGFDYWACAMRWHLKEYPNSTRWED